MIQRPIFKPHYHVEVVEDDGIVLLAEKSNSILQGRLYALLAPQLDGQQSVEEIVARLAPEAADEVREALALLEKRGYISESHSGESSGLSAGEVALWSRQNIDPQTAARRLQETTVEVSAFGDVCVEPFIEVLQSLRINVVAQAGQLGVVLTDDYLRSDLRAYNEQALDNGRPWMLIKPVGQEVWLGPIFRPDQTGCWQCLAQRLSSNREVENFLQQKKKSFEPFPIVRAASPATQQVAWNLAAGKIAEWIVREELPDLEGRILSFDVRSMQSQAHALVWRPQCPACGYAGDDEDTAEFERPPQPVVLESRKKIFTVDGGHRIATPEETIKRYAYHVSPITGAVSRLERQAVSNDGVIHAYSANHNTVVWQSSLKSLLKGMRSRSGGKGASDAQAKASGLCEALERHSGVFHGDEPRRKARLQELGEAAIHPNLCMLYSERQYQERDIWNAKGSRFNIVPVRFVEETEIEWSPVWSLTRQQERWLPTAFCYYRYPLSRENMFCMGCSNGNAAGNTLEEAILQGFFELVERDSVALWWYNRVPRPAVNVESFDEPYLREVAAFFEKRQRNLWVLDLTSDLQIPVFAALSRRTDGKAQRIMLGFGAHLDARIALLRAVTELNQMLPGMLHEEEHPDAAPLLDNEAMVDTEISEWLQTATVENQPYLLPQTSTSSRVPSDFPRRWTDDLKEDVLVCQHEVERHGLEMLVLDQTRPDIGLPVVKVIVPGLRHFWARYAPGRLYDVPVKLGWLTQPREETDLNPIPMFL